MTQIIDMHLVQCVDRMRRGYGDLDSLKESMHERGLLQAIGVQLVDGQYKLLWGGRRLSAAVALGWSTIEAKVCESMRDYEASELEFLENFERKSLTWQEECMGIARIHAQRVRQNALVGEKWGQRETGKLLGIAVGNVNYTLKVAEYLMRGDEEVQLCPNMAEALRLLLRRRDQEFMEHQGQKPGPKPNETFFTQEDIDDLQKNKTETPPPPSGDGQKPVYHMKLFSNAVDVTSEYNGVIFANLPSVQAKWILRGHDPRLNMFKPGIIFHDLSIVGRSDGSCPFIPNIRLLEFCCAPGVRFSQTMTTPIFRDNAALEKILYGEDALSFGFWEWFFNIVQGTMDGVYFEYPPTIEGISTAIRLKLNVGACLDDEQLAKLQKEMAKYGDLQITRA